MIKIFVIVSTSTSEKNWKPYFDFREIINSLTHFLVIGASLQFFEFEIHDRHTTSLYVKQLKEKNTIKKN